jgi:membrane-associated protease RseP (regulator of RpoE activity)
MFATGAVAQDQPHYFTPIAGDGQRLRGSAGINEGAIGVDARKTDGGYKVGTVTPAGPAQKSGIQIGDVITSLDGNSLASTTQADFYRLLAKKPGEPIQVSYIRNGQPGQIAIAVESRAKVYPTELTMPPGVGQQIFDGHAAVTVGVSQASSQPQSVTVWVLLSNIDAPIVSVDDSKFFVLDGQGQQLRHLSLEEVKYSIQSWVAQNLHGGNNPPPPPPLQHHYIITGTQNGNYTFGEIGSMGTLSGNSSSTYTVHDQPDYSVSGWYTFGAALRQRADRKHNDQIMQQAQQALSQCDAAYFRSQSPVIPGENRGGGIQYWTGSRQATGPFKVVLFLNDPSGKQEIAKFEFR